MNNIRLLLLLLIAAVAAASWWLNKMVEQSASGQQAANKPHQVDFYFENFTITRFNEVGLPRYRLQGKRMLHYEDDDTSDIDVAHLQLTPKGQPGWRIDANEAWISANGTQVHLRGDVVVHRLPFKQQSSLQITTQLLKLRPDDNFAETDQPVEIRSPEWNWQATGMIAELDKGKLSLLSNVKGRYAQPTP